MVNDVNGFGGNFSLGLNFLSVGECVEFCNKRMESELQNLSYCW